MHNYPWDSEGLAPVRSLSLQSVAKWLATSGLAESKKGAKKAQDMLCVRTKNH
jgi:hypothetical protein